MAAQQSNSNTEDEKEKKTESIDLAKKRQDIIIALERVKRNIIDKYSNNRKEDRKILEKLQEEAKKCDFNNFEQLAAFEKSLNNSKAELQHNITAEPPKTQLGIYFQFITDLLKGIKRRIGWAVDIYHESKEKKTIDSILAQMKGEYKKNGVSICPSSEPTINVERTRNLG